MSDAEDGACSFCGKARRDHDPDGFGFNDSFGRVSRHYFTRKSDEPRCRLCGMIHGAFASVEAFKAQELPVAHWKDQLKRADEMELSIHLLAKQLAATMAERDAFAASRDDLLTKLRELAGGDLDWTRGDCFDVLRERLVRANQGSISEMKALREQLADLRLSLDFEREQSTGLRAAWLSNRFKLEAAWPVIEAAYEYRALWRRREPIQQDEVNSLRVKLFSALDDAPDESECPPRSTSDGKRVPSTGTIAKTSAAPADNPEETSVAPGGKKTGHLDDGSTGEKRDESSQAQQSNHCNGGCEWIGEKRTYTDLRCRAHGVIRKSAYSPTQPDYRPSQWAGRSRSSRYGVALFVGPEQVEAIAREIASWQIWKRPSS